MEDLNGVDNVIELSSVMDLSPAVDAPTCWFDLPPRHIAPADWVRYRAAVAEIFEAFGMDLETPGTEDTPERFLRALYEATAGYDGDPKLATTFPAEASSAAAAPGQVIEGPIEFHCLCEHHALPFFGYGAHRLPRRRADRRDLEADAARAALRAPVHGAGAARRADRGRARSR